MYGLVAPATLIFYGLGLISASKYSYNELELLGYLELILGTIASYYMGSGLLFWMIGFGIGHIVLGFSFIINMIKNNGGFNLLNKAFDSRVRLGLMSILSVNDWISYKEVKNLLNLTDGNLASHIQALEELILEIKKQFIGKKPLTTYRVTELGKKCI